MTCISINPPLSRENGSMPAKVNRKACFSRKLWLVQHLMHLLPIWPPLHHVPYCFNALALALELLYLSSVKASEMNETVSCSSLVCSLLGKVWRTVWARRCGCFRLQLCWRPPVWPWITFLTIRMFLRDVLGVLSGITWKNICWNNMAYERHAPVLFSPLSHWLHPLSILHNRVCLNSWPSPG